MTNAIHRQVSSTVPLLLTVLLVWSASVQAQDEFSLEQEMDLFLEWFPGEYDNNEQVWQQREDGLSGEELHERIHHHFIPVDLPAVGEHVYFAFQTIDDDPEQVYRQRIYRFEMQPEEDAIRLDILSMENEENYRDAWQDPSLLADITMENLRGFPGCEVYWRYKGDYFEGSMVDRACHFYSERSGMELYISDTLRLTANEIWIDDQATDENGNHVWGRDRPYFNRKVRRFSGWMGVRKDRVNPDYSGDEMYSAGGFTIHNEGGRQSILDDEGNPTGYGIELAQLTYQNTRVPILKLGIIDESTGETVNYSWTAVDSSRVGINVRWFQSGLTLIEELE